jgi:hypothetical protein
VAGTEGTWASCCVCYLLVDLATYASPIDTTHMDERNRSNGIMQSVPCKERKLNAALILVPAAAVDMARSVAVDGRISRNAVLWAVRVSWAAATCNAGQYSGCFRRGR